MTRARALTGTLRSVIALLTALLVSVAGATALSTSAFAGQGQAPGQAPGQQANHANKPDKPDQAETDRGQGKAPQQSKASHGKADQEAAQPSTSHSSGGGQSAGKAQGGGSEKAQKPARADKPSHAQETEPSRGQSAQAHENKTSRGASGSKDGDKGNPPGNNGTVKLAGFEAPNGPGHAGGDGSTPMHPSNDPHLSCSFSVEWYGFDSAVTSQVTFEQVAPTRGGTEQHDSVTLHADDHSGGGSTAGYDGVETYHLDFEGEPHAKHGYHVKLTTNTPYSQGSDVKHKVFWVEPCEEDTDTGGEEDTDTGGEEDTDTGGEEDTDTGGEEDTDTGGEEDTDTGGEEDTDGQLTETEVLGAQATAGTTLVQGAEAAAQNSGSAQAAGADVPTSVEAGLTGEEWSRSVLPLLAVLFGFGMTFVALARRRAHAHAVSTRD